MLYRRFILNIFGLKISKKFKPRLKEYLNDFKRQIESLNDELKLTQGLIKTQIISENNKLFPEHLSDYKNKDSFKTCLLFKYEAMNITNTGEKSVNLGDYVQTYAVENALRKTFPEINLKFWDRDNLINYKDTPCFTVMQGFFTYPNCYSYSYMPSENVYPIFIGFHLHINQQEEIVNMLLYKPNFFDGKVIGCRDTETKEFFEKIGVRAYCSRCLTLCLDKREKLVGDGKIFIDSIPEAYYKYIPSEILNKAVFTNQRSVDINLTALEYANSYKKYYSRTKETLNRYKNEASLVITAGLHCAAPCIAMGIPVVVISAEPKSSPVFGRFDALKGIVPVYTVDDLISGKIDFNPVCPDIENLKMNILKNFELTIKQEMGMNVDLQELDETRKAIENYKLV